MMLDVQMCGYANVQIILIVRYYYQAVIARYEAISNSLTLSSPKERVLISFFLQVLSFGEDLGEASATLTMTLYYFT